MGACGLCVSAVCDVVRDFALEAKAVRPCDGDATEAAIELDVLSSVTFGTSQIARTHLGRKYNTQMVYRPRCIGKEKPNGSQSAIVMDRWGKLRSLHDRCIHTPVGSLCGPKPPVVIDL